MSSSSREEQDPSTADGLGPFITVVSVDGGLQCGNKLTVITPTEICETSKQGKQAVIRKLDTSHDKAPSSSQIPSKLTQPGGDLGKVHNHIGKSNYNCNNSGSNPSSSSKVQQRPKPSQETTTTTGGAAANGDACGGGAYVTVLALSEEQSLHDTGKSKSKSGIPVRAEPASLSGKKSFVNICTNNLPTSTTAKGPTSSYLPVAAAPSSNAVPENRADVPEKPDAGEDEKQMVMAGNKAVLAKGKEIPQMHHVKNASIVEITMKECSSNNNHTASKRNLEINDASSHENDMPKKVREPVVIYRLPGERLGFALKFDGGTISATEMVTHLLVQACAEGSPAKRTVTSWGHLGEGDEIVEIEKVPVNSMTRMDCVQALKDSSVAVQLVIEHTYTPEEIQLLEQQRRENNGDERAKCCDENSKLDKSRLPVGNSGIPTFQKSTKESKLKEPSAAHKEVYQKSGRSAQTGISEKGNVSKGPHQLVTNQDEAEPHQFNELAAVGNTFTDAFLSAESDASEIKFDEEIGTGRSHSRIPIKRGHATLSSSPTQGKNNAEPFQCNRNHPLFANAKEEERLDELKLQPPVGFEDELHSPQQHSHVSVGQSNYYQGKNKSEQIPASSANDRHYQANEANSEKFNESCAQEDVAIFGLTENHHLLQQPDLMPNGSGSSSNAAGSTNGNHQHTPHLLMSSNGSIASLHNAHGFVHLSGNENLSISTCCESDETESTRSTVVSRLSIGSSMTSISAVMAVSGCCSDSSNNTVTLTQISESGHHSSHLNHGNGKRRNSPNSSLSNNVIMGLEGLATSSETHGPEDKVNEDYQHEPDLQPHHHHHHLPLQQVGQQHRSNVNNASTIPYSSCSPARGCCREGSSAVAEIPLEPPLSFQDKEEQVRRSSRNRRGDAPVNAAQEMMMQAFSNIITANSSTPSSFHDDASAENSNDANEVGGAGCKRIALQPAPRNQNPQPFDHHQDSDAHARSHHHHQQINNQNIVDSGGSRKGRFASNDSFNNDSNFNTSNNTGRIVGAITDGNNNEQEIFDDDELALLADELGLDQEDEDLFKAMLAEVEAAEEDLEEYGPLILSSSAAPEHAASSQQRRAAKHEHQESGTVPTKTNNHAVIDDAKHEKSHCERNQQEAVVASAKRGADADNALVAPSYNDNNNIVRKKNDDNATVRRIDDFHGASQESAESLGEPGLGNSKSTQPTSHPPETWTISNPHDNRDVRGLGRITM